MMPWQLSVGLLWTLLLAWQAGVGHSKSIDHSDLVELVFTNLQKESTGDTLPPFPEGIELELNCQATASKTFWYERRPPNKYPDTDKDKLPSTSSNPVPGVKLTVYTILSLTKEDDGRELWCTMESSTAKKVVQLDVVGPPTALDISYEKKNEGLEVSCSSDSVDPHLELCWYRGDERLQCKVPEEEGASPAAVMTHVSVDDVLKEPRLTCKVLFKEDRVLEILKENARTRFNDMLKGASVNVSMEVQDSAPCDENTPDNEPPTTKTITLREDRDSILCRKLVIREERITTQIASTTTPAPSTTPMASATTPPETKKTAKTTASASNVGANKVPVIVFASMAAVAYNLGL